MVSPQGEDEPECLTASPTTPCRTISYVITGGRTVVCMNGTFQNMSEDIQITNNTNGSHAITIVCISCVISDSKVTLYGSFGQIAHVSFVNLTIQNSNIQLRNIYISFKAVVLENVIIQDFGNTSTQVYIEQSNLRCTDMSLCGLSLHNSGAVKCIIKDSHMDRFMIDLSPEGLMLVINDSIIIQPYINVVAHSPPYLRIPSYILFDNTTFSQHRNTVTSSPLRQKRSAEHIHLKPMIILDLVNPYIHINSCTFNETHLDIVAHRQEFDQAYFLVVISDTHFTNSYYDGDGGPDRIGGYTQGTAGYTAGTQQLLQGRWSLDCYYPVILLQATG